MSQYNNQEPSKQAASDEIDLREVFKGIGNFFSRIGRSFIHGLLAVKRASKAYRLLILATIILFIGLGVFWRLSGRAYFSSSMVIESEYYDRDLMEGAIGELNSLAQQGAYGSLAGKLNISEDEAENLRSLQLEVILSEDDKMLLDAYLQSLQESKMSVDELVAVRDKLIKKNAMFRISIEVFSNDLLENIQAGLLHYLGSNGYVERRMLVEEENLRSLKGKLQDERAKLDGLKIMIAESFSQQAESSRTGSNNVILGENTTDPLNVYREDIQIYKEELAINKRLALLDNVEVIKSFTAFKKPANLSLLKVIVYSGLIGLVAAYIIVLLLEANKALNRYEQKNKEKKQLA